MSNKCTVCRNPFVFTGKDNTCNGCKRLARMELKRLIREKIIWKRRNELFLKKFYASKV